VSDGAQKSRAKFHYSSSSIQALPQRHLNAMPEIKMFRRMGKNFSSFGIPLLRPRPRSGNQFRLQSTLPEQKPFWSASKVLLLTTCTASLTYLYGVNDVSSHFKIPWINSAKPRYGNKRDMEKV
jgi:hypothetical protein